MKKQTITLGTILLSGFLYSQVGINTESPKATLDIVATPTDNLKIDGLIAPRLTGDELKSKDALYNGDQIGTIIYATEAASPTTPKTINVNESGYYYFDGNVWVKIRVGNSDSSIEPWYVQNTSNQAENNTDNIFQKGKVAIGFDATDAVSEKQLEIKGDMKAEFLDTDNFKYVFKTAQQSPLDPSMKENIMYITDNEDFNSANIYSMLGINKKSVAFINVDKTGNIEKFNAVFAASTADGGFVSLASETLDDKYASIGGITWTDTVEGAIQTRQKVEGKDINMDISVRPKTGITFKHGGITDYDSYTFPKNAPKEGQVLVGSSTSGSFVGKNLEWKDLQDVVILKSPNGNCFKISVDDNGSLSTIATSCL